MGLPCQEFLRAADIMPAGWLPSAETLAYDLAVRMALSQSGGEATSGLALDWAKCYDNLVLGLLRQVGDRVNIPKAISGPMLAAYAQPRAVLLNGSLAVERCPL